MRLAPALESESLTLRLPSLFVAAVALVLGYGLLLSIDSLAAFPTSLHFQGAFPYLADKPVGEDGFYMLLTSWNLAAGRGLTANFGAITTGVQPLSVLVFAVIAKGVMLLGGDKFTFVRAIIVAGAVNMVLLSLALGSLARVIVRDRDRGEFAFAVTATIACLSFYIFRTCTYGLETGIYLTLVALFLRQVIHYLRSPQRSVLACVALGLLLGVCGLARIDFGVVAAVFAVVLALRGQLRITELVIAGATAAAVVSPWFLWVHAVSGSWAPSSGPAQSALISFASAGPRLAAMVSALLQNAAPWIFAGGRVDLTVCAVVGALAFVWAIRRWGRKDERAADATAREVLFAYAAAIVVLAVVYVVFFWDVHFYGRYLSPASVLVFVAAGVAATRLEESLRVRFLTILFVTCCGVNAVLAFISLHHGAVGNSHAVTAGYVARELPRDAKVGAFQSGVVGYFNPNVVNLDGKLNPAALAAARNGHLGEYLAREHIDYVVDWREYIDQFFAHQAQRTDWQPCPQPVGNEFSVCMRRR